MRSRPIGQVRRDLCTRRRTIDRLRPCAATYPAFAPALPSEYAIHGMDVILPTPLAQVGLEPLELRHLPTVPVGHTRHQALAHAAAACLSAFPSTGTREDLGVRARQWSAMSVRGRRDLREGRAT